ncbi:MAG: hypothetical protein ACKV2O_03865 [Acidimicrobiales bacterium]
MNAHAVGPDVLAVAWNAARNRPDASDGELFVSQADQAALEWALRLASRWHSQVCVVSVGPIGVEALLREALAAGADRAVRVALEPLASQQAVARALADASRHIGAQWWCCGERGLQRASGAVPSLLAAELQWSAALGLVAGAPQVGPDADNAGQVADPVASVERGSVEVVRRLERGRRDRLAVRFPAVISVEAGSATLRRASLGSVLAAQQATITVLEPSRGRELSDSRVRVVGHRPYRPIPSGIAAPVGSSARDRIAALGGVYAGRDHAPRQVVGSPAAAAAAIIDALHTWGYLGDPSPAAGPGGLDAAGLAEGSGSGA